MSQLRTHLVIFTAAALLSGCSFVDNLLTGEDNSQDYPPGDSESVQQIPPSSAEQNAQPAITQTPVQGTPTPQGAGPPPRNLRRREGPLLAWRPAAAAS